MPNNKTKFFAIRRIRADGGGTAGRIDIYNEIDDRQFWGDEVTPSDFVTQLNGLGDVEYLDLHIFSPGGSVFAGLAIHNLLRQYPKTVNVYIEGICASIATVIACAGDNVYIADTAKMFFHKPSASFFFATFNEDDAQELADELRGSKDPMILAYCKKTKKKEEDINAILHGPNGNGTWMSAAQAIEAGFADDYIPDAKIPLDMAASIAPGIYNWRGNRLDYSKYLNAAQKPAGNNNKPKNRSGNMAFNLFGKKPKPAARGKPKAEVMLTETVCPSCGVTNLLNEATGEIALAGDAATPDTGGGTGAALATKVKSNMKAELFNITCLSCGADYVWNTDTDSDGDIGEEAIDAVPMGGDTPPDDVPTAGAGKSPEAEAAEAICPVCGAAVPYDTATAATNENGYMLQCQDCGNEFIEPFEAASPTSVPTGAKAAHLAGIKAERKRVAELMEISAAAPQLAGMVMAAIKSGATPDAMRKNAMKAVGAAANFKGAAYLQALARDQEAAGIIGMRAPQSSQPAVSIKDKARQDRINDYNARRGVTNNAN